METLAYLTDALALADKLEDRLQKMPMMLDKFFHGEDVTDLGYIQGELTSAALYVKHLIDNGDWDE